MQVIAPNEAPFPVRPIEEALTDVEIHDIAEAVMDGDPTFFNYHVAEIVPDRRRPDRAWVAVRKGDTYVTYCLLIGYSGHHRQRRIVALFQWGHYGLTRHTYAANLHRRAR